MKPYNYSPIPFVRLLIPLLAGRILSAYLVISIPLYVLVFVGCLLGLVFIYYSRRTKYSQRWLVGVTISLMLFALGLVSRPHYIFESHLFNNTHVYSAVVKQVVKDTDDKQSIILSCSPADTVCKFYFKALLYVRNDSGSIGLLPGDKLAFEAQLTEFRLTGNPFAFEYAEYMGGKDVKGQFYVNANLIQHLGNNFSLSRFFYLTREKADEKLRHLKLGEAQFGVLSALVLGDKSLLDYKTKTYFSNSGAIHILSVSGLHVGIVYLMLMLSFGSIGKGKVGLVKVVAVLLILWFYAAMAGMSPSVFRATLMFSIFVISKRISQRYNIYHSMAITAFIILIINPYTALHAGFWLSFLAVASIVYFYPKIYGCLYFSSPWAKYLWALFSVSLAAQIGTAPLAINLFGYFPTWFLISNFLIIPILPFILISALGVVVLPFDFIVVRLIAEPLSAMINYLIEIVQWVGSLPNATFVGLQLSFFQVVLFYAVLLFFVVWQYLKLGRYLVYALLFLFVGLVSISASSYHKYRRQFLVVHQIKGQTAVSLTSHNTGNFWFNEPLGDKEISYAITPLVLNQELSSFQQHIIESAMVWPIVSPYYHVLLINGEADIGDLLFKKVDIIVLTSRLKSYQIKTLLSKVEEQKLVFDSSFSVSQSRYYQKQLQQHKLSAHFVSLHGAFVLINNCE